MKTLATHGRTIRCATSGNHPKARVICFTDE
jgi:hypothetical protein